MDTLVELASLTDEEASQCLNRILESIHATDPDIPITFPDELAGIMRGVAVEAGTQVIPKNDANLPGKGAKAVRLLLLEFREDSQLRARLEAALATDRPVLFVDPITIALVMAGIVVVLSTRCEMKYKKSSTGQSEFEVNITKNASSDTLIKKFFSLF